jgi:hypothetical protein
VSAHYFGKKDRHDEMYSLKRMATFGEWFADDPSDFIFFPGERSAILLAVEMAKTIIAKYDQRERKCSSIDGVSNKRPCLENGNEIRLTKSTSSSSSPSNASQVTMHSTSSQPVLTKGKTLAIISSIG